MSIFYVKGLKRVQDDAGITDPKWLFSSLADVSV